MSTTEAALYVMCVAVDPAQQAIGAEVGAMLGLKIHSEVFLGLN